ncbi:hypothetical protein MRB53_024276 [Persea americana]|uniref:Uncharacterized protein n=1 Tax=Persea americana TaxID=3435 RepID=A0ACC2LCA6_PERAE|nr:hypothetical protein MRB53_024276 [Persea americana]
MAGGSATSGEVKWAVAKTTAKDEFCIPTCRNEVLVSNSYRNKTLNSPIDNISIEIARRCGSLNPQKVADKYLQQKNLLIPEVL